MSSTKAIITLMLISILSLVSIGCSDSDVAAPPVVVVDTAPPAIPFGLAVEYEEGVLTLSWAQNTTDSDLAGFVARRDNHGVVTTLISDPTVVQYLQDTPAIGANTYQIYSVDLVGNESAISSIDYYRFGDPRPDENDRDLDRTY